MAFVSLHRKRVPFQYVVDCEKFILLEIRPFKKYVDNQATDAIEGYSYLVTDTVNFDKRAFKVKGQQPLMNNDSLQKLREQGQTISITFDNPTVYMYWDNSTKTYKDSFAADAAALVQDR